MNKILAVNSIAKSFGDVDVLHDISLSIDKGEFLVLLGPSGCGKSTLLNCIAGLEEVSAGQVKIDGVDMTERPPKDRDLAMVFQSYALYPTMSVAENISFGLKVRGASKAEQKAAAERVGKTLQIEDLLERKPSELSGGQRQRVAIGRALVRDPKLFLFDEPLSNLDAKLRVEMRAEIRHLHERVNASIVYVTHDQIEAMTLATQICVLRDGIIQQFGSPDEVYQNPANIFVAGFMGSPPMNLLPAELRDGNLHLGPECTIPVSMGMVGSGSFTCGIRPENIDLDNAVSSSDKIILKAAVSDIEHTGSDTFVTCKLGENSLIARFSANFANEPGNEIALSFSQNDLHLFDAESGQRVGRLQSQLS